MQHGPPGWPGGQYPPNPMMPPPSMMMMPPMIPPTGPMGSMYCTDLLKTCNNILFVTFSEWGNEGTIS